MENLKVTFVTGKVKNYECENCNEALTILAELKRRSIPILKAWYIDIDLNMSLECLYDIASYLLRRDNNTELGKKYLEAISMINTCFN